MQSPCVGVVVASEPGEQGLRTMLAHLEQHMRGRIAWLTRFWTQGPSLTSLTYLFPDAIIDLEALGMVGNHFGRAASPTPVPGPSGLTVLLTACAAAIGNARLQSFTAAMLAGLMLGSWGGVTNAQSIDWMRQFGGPGTDLARGVIVDPFGDIYVAGMYNSNPGDFQQTDFLLAKHSPSGDVLWSKQYDFSSSDRHWAGLAADQSGNVYFGGSVLDPSSGRTPILAKVDSQGGLLWDRTLPGPEIRTVRDVATDGQGNVVVSISNSPNMTIGKFNSDGQQLWMRDMRNDMGDAWNNLAIDSNGDILVSGPLNSGKVIRKLSASGSLLWDREFDLSNFGNALAVTTDIHNNVFLAGTTSGDLASENQGRLDAFVRKYDTNGNLIWTSQFGSAEDDSIWSIAVDASGELFVTGGTAGDLGGAHQGSGDAFLGALDSTGALRWLHQFGTTAGDMGFGVVLDQSGAAYVAGQTNGELGEQPAGGTDAFLARFTTTLLGDTDNDGDVDLADLNAVRNNFGGAGGEIPGDVNDDQIVDLEDLNFVRNHFGEGVGAMAVPEPPAGALAGDIALTLGLAAVLQRRKTSA